MSASPREIVRRTLEFDQPPRAPRDIWALPVALQKYQREYDAIIRDYPIDACPATGVSPFPPAATCMQSAAMWTNGVARSSTSKQA